MSISVFRCCSIPIIVVCLWLTVPSALRSQCSTCTDDCNPASCNDGAQGYADGSADFCAFPSSGCPQSTDVYIDGCCCANYTPILIDLDGHGFHMTDLSHGVRFSFNGNQMQVSWTKANGGDAWLVLDRNGNGVIDDASELFGNYTAQPQPPPYQARNGFLALAVFDTPEHGGNGDDVIDEHDAIYSSLLVWQDLNHNGISEPNELHKLKEVGILAIELHYQESKRVDDFGNRFRYRAKVIPMKGAPDGRWAWDVLLQASK